MKRYCTVFLLFVCFQSYGQLVAISGKVYGVDTLIRNARIEVNKLGSILFTDSTGAFNYTFKANVVYEIIVQADGYRQSIERVKPKDAPVFLNIKLNPIAKKLDEVTVVYTKDRFSTDRKNDVEGTTITAGKKNEVIKLDNLNANTAINSSRQIFAQVAGINVIENDAGGVQMSIATRGLNPNRITEFNSRQNGYDISADALGYPETYYTPPADALDKIEIIRGAASLQYGSQFGGLLNFVYKKGNRHKRIDIEGKQSLAQYNTFVSHLNVGGQYKRWNYFAMFNHRQGDSWRKNARYNINTFYTSLEFKAKRWYTGSIDYTFMQYNAQQPGGLTDIQFKTNAQLSFRNRNWFNAQWNIIAQKNEWILPHHFTVTWVNFSIFHIAIVLVLSLPLTWMTN